MDIFKISTENNLQEILSSIIYLIDNKKYRLSKDKYEDIFIITLFDEFRKNKVTSKFKIPIKKTFENNDIINDIFYIIEYKRKNKINDIKIINEPVQISSIFNKINSS